MAISRASGELVCVYAIGNIEAFPNGVDPNKLYAGTVWVRLKGRVIVGVDESQSEFNSVNKTGGSIYMQSHSHYLSLTSNSNGSHTHDIYYQNRVAYGGNTWAIMNSPSGSGVTTNVMKGAGNHSHTVSGNTNSSGGGQAQNLQPYITKFLWERTA